MVYTGRVGQDPGLQQVIDVSIIKPREKLFQRCGDVTAAREGLIRR